MSKLVLEIDKPGVAQLVAMADGLLREGQTELGAQLYEAALARSEPKDRRAIRVKLGLARHPTRNAAAHLAALDALKMAGRDVFLSEGLATWAKTLPFFDDARFREIADRHAGLLGLPNWHWNLQAVLWAVSECRTIEGDFVELGVFHGHTTQVMADYVDFGSWPKSWWLFDTFEGIPDDQRDQGWEDVNRTLYEGAYSFEEVRQRFARYGNIRVVKGRVPEILVQAAPERIAFMHVDLNNSAAEIAALDLLYDRISPGGIIIFDDFCWASARAQYDAEREWFEERGRHVLALPTGQGVFVKRAEA
jgi:O-methyltransferase